MSVPVLPKLYDMRITYRNLGATNWYGPYALTDDDVEEIKNTDWDKRMRIVETREHECDDPINGGCGHMQAGLPAPY